MGSSSADVLRSLDLASCAAELALGPFQPSSQQHDFPQVYNPMPEQLSAESQHNEPDTQQPEADVKQCGGRMDGSTGVLLPKGNLVMKLLQVHQASYLAAFSVVGGSEFVPNQKFCSRGNSARLLERLQHTYRVTISVMAGRLASSCRLDYITTVTSLRLHPLRFVRMQ